MDDRTCPITTQFFNNDVDETYSKVQFCGQLFYGNNFEEKISIYDGESIARRGFFYYHNLFYSFPAHIHIAIVPCNLKTKRIASLSI